MSKKVKVDQYGIIHSQATCEDCDYCDGHKSEENCMQRLRNRINSHVIKTGHTVMLETGNATKYSPRN